MTNSHKKVNIDELNNLQQKNIVKVRLDNKKSYFCGNSLKKKMNLILNNCEKLIDGIYCH